MSALRSAFERLYQLLSAPFAQVQEERIQLRDLLDHEAGGPRP